MFVYFLLVSFPSWPVRPENKQWERASMNGEPCIFVLFLKWLLFPAVAVVVLVVTPGREREREREHRVCILSCSLHGSAVAVSRLIRLFKGPVCRFLSFILDVGAAASLEFQKNSVAMSLTR